MMALIASCQSIIPKDLSGEALQKAEDESYKDNDGSDDNDDHDDKDDGNNADDDVDRLRSCWRQQIGLQLITEMNLGGDIQTKKPWATNNFPKVCSGRRSGGYLCLP